MEPYLFMAHKEHKIIMNLIIKGLNTFNMCNKKNCYIDIGNSLVRPGVLCLCFVLVLY